MNESDDLVPSRETFKSQCQNIGMFPRPLYIIRKFIEIFREENKFLEIGETGEIRLLEICIGTILVWSRVGVIYYEASSIVTQISGQVDLYFVFFCKNTFSQNR